jgi:hypothetical protein
MIAPDDKTVYADINGFAYSSEPPVLRGRQAFQLGVFRGFFSSGLVKAAPPPLCGGSLG